MDGWLQLSPEEWTAVRLSLRVATVAMLTSLPIGIAVAYLLARYKFPGESVVDGIVLLPLILPPVVTGYLLLLTFGRRGPIGSFLAEQFWIVIGLIAIDLLLDFLLAYPSDLRVTTPPRFGRTLNTVDR
jgi:ABC-type molybdate transport system permease subunit